MPILYRESKSTYVCKTKSNTFTGSSGNCMVLMSRYDAQALSACINPLNFSFCDHTALEEAADPSRVLKLLSCDVIFELQAERDGRATIIQPGLLTKKMGGGGIFCVLYLRTECVQNRRANVLTAPVPPHPQNRGGKKLTRHVLRKV